MADVSFDDLIPQNANGNTSGGSGSVSFDDLIPNKGMGAWDKFKNALEYGTSGVAHGLASGLKNTIGPGKVSGALDTFGNAIAPDANYTPASTSMDDPSKTMLERAQYLPRAILESAPGLAADLTAGAIGGGAPGFIAMNAARNVGPNIDAATAASGNQEPSAWDYARGIGATAAQAALARLGINPALKDTLEVGSTSLAPIATGIAKAAATDAGTNILSEGLQKAVVDKQNPLDDPQGLGLAGLQGALTGAGVRALHGIQSGEVGDLNQNIKFRDLFSNPNDPEGTGDNVGLANRVADMYQNREWGNTKEAFNSINEVDKVLQDNTDKWLNSKGLKAQLDDVNEANNFQDNTQETIDNMSKALKAGKVLENSDIRDAGNRLPGSMEGANLTQALLLQNAQNKIKTMGNYNPTEKTFGGGIQQMNGPMGASVGDWLSPFGKKGRWGTLSAALGVNPLHATVPFTFMPHVPIALGMGIAGTQQGLNLATRGIDKLTGNTNTLGNFMQRFGPGPNEGYNEAYQTGPKIGNYNTPPTDTTFPSYLQTQKDVAAAAQAQKANDKATAASQRQAAKDTADLAKATIRASQAQAKAKLSAAKAFAAEEKQRTNNPVSQGLATPAAAQIKSALIKQKLMGETNPFTEQLKGSKSKGTQSNEGTKEPKATKAPTGTTEMPEERMLTVTHGKQSVSVPASSVANPGTWAASVGRRLKTRGSTVAAVKAGLPKEFHPAMDQLETNLNQQSYSTPELAQHEVETAVNKLPFEHRAKALDTFNNPKFWASFATGK